jgi:hypothetical protein
MLTRELIAAFSKRELLPVDVNDVKSFIIQKGIQDDIEFIGVEFDTDILQGWFKRFRRPVGVYGEAVNCTNIFYPINQSQDWQRFICCKELLHVLDPEQSRVINEDQIRDLATKIGLPREMQDPLRDGEHTWSDRIAEFQALAVLFPMECRNILLEPLKKEQISVSDIAKLVDIPRKYVGLAMSPLWDSFHNQLLRL